MTHEQENTQTGEWTELAAPIVRICTVASKFKQKAEWNAVGAEALGKLLTDMAEKLDGYVIERATLLSQVRQKDEALRAIARLFDEQGVYTGGDFEPLRKALVQIVVALSPSSAETDDDIRRATIAAAIKAVEEMRDKYSTPTGDQYSQGVWDQSQRIIGKLRATSASNLLRQSAPVEASAKASRREARVKYLADRFLAWRLPKSVCADICATEKDYKFPRSGTNLLTASEAKEMINYLFAWIDLGAVGNPASPPVENPCNKIFDHKWLDPQCVESGCQSRVLSSRQAPSSDLIGAACEFLRAAEGQTSLSAVQIGGEWLTSTMIADKLAALPASPPADAARLKASVLALMERFRSERMAWHINNRTNGFDPDATPDHLSREAEASAIVTLLPTDAAVKALVEAKELEGFINGLMVAGNMKSRFHVSDDTGRVINDIRRQIDEKIEEARSKLATLAQHGVKS